MSEVGQNLLGRLLGLDAEQSKGKTGKRSSALPPAAATVKAMQGVKISSALKGLNITSNFMWLVLFVGFFLWLFVVYWIRHNEPFANHVLGPGAAHSKTGHDDRRLIENMRDALPFKVSKDTGYVYVPGKPDITARFGRPVNAPAEPQGYTAPASAVASGQVVNHPVFVPPPAQHQLPVQQTHQQFAAPVPQQVPPYAYQQHAAVPYVPPPALTGAPQRTIGYGAAYMVPHQTPDGARVKMIVNR